MLYFRFLARLGPMVMADSSPRIFRTDFMDFPDCLPILLSLSVFTF